MTFEEYMNLHVFDFAPLYYLPHHVGGPTYGQRIGDNSVLFIGKDYTIPLNYTDWRTVSRWETFKGLSLGLGFDYDLELRYNNLDELYNWWNRVPKEHFKFRIFWKSDIANETPITLTRCIEHTENTIPKTKKYLFAGYRHAIFTLLQPEQPVPAFTAIRGILFDGTNIIETDSSDNVNPPHPHYPFFLRTNNGGFTPFNPATTLQFITGNGAYSKYDDSEINAIPLPLYSHPGFGGGHAAPGAITYCRLFNCNPFLSNFLPIQRYTMNSYKRYIIESGKKGKKLKVKLKDVPGIKLFKHVRFDDGDGMQSYEVNALRDIDLFNKTITIEVTQL